MTNRSSRGSEQPEKAVALRRSINDRDLIRELHQGQRLCEPQYKAEHMAAPDQSVKRPKTLLPRRRRPHTAFGEVERSCTRNVWKWHEAEVDLMSVYAWNTGRS
jgi:hypothetical protein